MSQTLSFKRIGLLLKRYFVENQNYEIYLWSILTLIFMFFRSEGTAQLITLIVGIVYATRFFKIFAYPSNGTHYLMIPATQVEKLVTVFLLNTFYFFLMIMITSAIGNFIGTILRNLIYGISTPFSLQFFFPYSKLNSDFDITYLLKNFGVFATLQAIFTLGSLYFKRNSIAKTLLTLMMISILFGIIEYTVFKVTMGSLLSVLNQYDGFQIAWNEIIFPKGMILVWKIIGYLLIPFCWIVSYFRLTEKEIK